MKTLLQAIIAGISGFIFALGLGVSGMTDPVKVYSFMDVFGHWDPTLIFVMLGAIAVHAVAYWVIRRQNSPLLAANWKIPEKKEITLSLILGSMIFGMGWSLAGYCPGPAIVTLATFEFRPILFVLSMVVGMFLFQTLDRKFKFKR